MILDHWVVRDDGNRKIYIQFWDLFNDFSKIIDKYDIIVYNMCTVLS